MIVYSASVNSEPRIARVKFHVMSAEQIKKLSVVEVCETTVYNKGFPTPNGIQDVRMGTVDRRLLCATCHRDTVHCQGHSGHITLPWPMYHSVFFDTVIKTLRCTCFMCGRVCLNEPHPAPDLVGKARFLAVYALIRTRKRCPHCNAVRPSFVRQSMQVRVDWPADTEWESDDERAFCTRPFTQADALSILQSIPHEDCAWLGFDPVASHPRHMMMTNLLVPTPAMRPTIMASQGSKARAQDDITIKLQDILKKVHELRAAMRAEACESYDATPSADVHDRIQRLQYEIFTVVNNSVRGQRPSVQRSGLPTRSYIGRLKGKEGRIRGNLMGKRVDFCARAVISPGPLLDIDEVGIPERIALGLTIPEIVADHNIERLTARVRAGSGELRGAETVITGEGVVIHLAQCATRKHLSLALGWTVERYLQNGDVVAFNRQPSLHRLGLMGHRVRIVRDLTLRLNLSVTAPYNADFDGDEMNLHVPQSDAARASVRMLMMVPQHIISPQANRPCMGVVQDSLVGAYRMTRARELLTKQQVVTIVAQIRHVPVAALPTPCIRIRGVPRWSGKQIVSLVLPRVLNIDREGHDMARLQPQSKLVIRDGQILSGQLSKSVLGTASGGIIDVLFRDIGPARTAHFLSDIQRVVIAYNELRGFSVGIADCVIEADGQAQVEERIRTAMCLSNDIAHDVARMQTTPDDAAQAETTIRRLLSKALTQAGSIVESSLGDDNAIRTMVMSGSKGSVINLSQIHACVGQQSVEGKRIQAPSGERILSCFSEDDRSLESQGFVQSSYKQGLTPSEFYFHSMGGREGIVDTAVKTAQTGYIQRRQVKAMESHRVEYDGTVRNSADGIIQFCYGESGFDPCRVERVRLPTLLQSEAEIRQQYGPVQARRILAARTRMMRQVGALGTRLDDRVTLPFNPVRAKRMFASRTVAAAQPSAELRALSAFVDALPNATVQLAMYTHFDESALMRVPPDDIRELHAFVDAKIRGAAIDAGEMVGCVAAQSVGEPTTQMSLRATEVVVVRDATGIHARTIGEVVDSYCVRGLTPSDLEVVGVSPCGRVRWADVRGVSRHAANGPMVCVHLQSGRCVTGTASHSYLVRSPQTGRIEPVRGDAVRTGDLMPVARLLPNVDTTMRCVGRRLVMAADSSEHDAAYAETVEFMVRSWWFSSYVTESELRITSVVTGMIDAATFASDTMLTMQMDPQLSHVAALVLMAAGCRYAIDAEQAHTWNVSYDDVRSMCHHVYWDAVTRVEELGVSDETVYDFTVDQELQSFMLASGLFVHNTLNTFHFAGTASKNVTLGLPRLQELLTVSRNMKTSTLTLRFPNSHAQNAAFMDYFANTLPVTTLGDIVMRTDIVFDPHATATTVAADAWMVATAARLEGSPPESACDYVVRLTLNQALMQARRITPPHVRRILKMRMGTRANIVASETNAPEWVVRIRMSYVREMVDFVGMPHERQPLLVQRIASVILKTLVISGHGSVTSTCVREETVHRLVRADDSDGARIDPVEATERVIDAFGCSLSDMAVATAVDWYRCYSNDILDVQATLGISAAAEVLFAELKDVISFDGTYVYPGHLSLIVDTMSRGGRLQPLNRFGVNREHENALARCSYEETPDILTEAAIFAENVPSTGVSTSIILGQRASIGTGIVDVRFNGSSFPMRLAHSTFTGVVRSSVRTANTSMPPCTREYVDVHPPTGKERPVVSLDASNDTRVPAEVARTFYVHSPDVSDEEDDAVPMCT